MLIAMLAGSAIAAPLTPGNLVIYRVGDGASALSGASTAVFLDEYTPLGALVQSIAMPTAISGINRELTASGTALTEGFLTRSTNGQYLVLTGYAAPVGVAGISSTPSGTFNRTVGRVDQLGNVDTSTALTDFSSGLSPRSAVSSNGSDLWVTGGSDVRYTVPGSTTSTQLNTGTFNGRQIQIFNGQLYVSSASAANAGVNTVGTGLPTTSGQTITQLPGLSSVTNPSTYSYFLADLSGGVPGLDTLYLADDSLDQIQKFSLIAGTWISNGSVAANNPRGLTGSINGAIVSLYATLNENQFVSLFDPSGYGAPLIATVSPLATATTNTAFRGVAFAPIPEPATIVLLAAGALALARRRYA